METNEKIQIPSVSQDETLNSPEDNSSFMLADIDLLPKQHFWFIICHLTSGKDTIDMVLHYILCTQPGKEPFIQAIVSVINTKTGKYITEQRIQKPEETYPPEGTVDIQLQENKTQDSSSDISIKIDFEHIAADLTLRHKGLLLADLRKALSPFYNDISYEFSFPDMMTAGTLSIDGSQDEVQGISWVNHHWSSEATEVWINRKWAWFGIVLENGDRIHLWNSKDENEYAFATVLHPGGEHAIAYVEPLTDSASEPWKSPVTGYEYPTRWLVSIPSLKANLDIRPLSYQEKTGHYLKGHKYEGACTVTGEVMGVKVKGEAVAELTASWN